MKLLVLNGPNINMLGIREPDVYGVDTYADLQRLIDQTAQDLGIDIVEFQSNHEGVLVDAIQAAYGVYDGIVINPAAYTHTSIAILDALQAVQIPSIEVHISDVSKRQNFRQISYIRSYVLEVISGRGIDGYRQALVNLYKRLAK